MSSASTPWVHSSLAADPDLAELVELFVGEMPERIENLLKLYDAGGREDFRRAVHLIKGAAGRYGYQSVPPMAARLEQSIKTDGTAEQIHLELDALLDLCRRIRSGVAE